ncbi:MAG: DNA replication and repair protein RecF [Treponemataceae bacterium]
MSLISAFFNLDEKVFFCTIMLRSSTLPFLSITVKNYRNLADRILDVAYPEVFLIGKNGQGKTNLLDAIYLLAYGNSFRTKSDTELYKKGNDSFFVSGLFRERENVSHTVTVYSKQRKKEITKNAKKIADRKELVTTIPCIIFCHSDIEFANGEMQKRRFFLDQTLSLYNAEYIDLLRSFNKILKIRNTVLKNRQASLLDSVDIQFAQAGLEIVQRREALIREINRLFTGFYKTISDIDEVRLEYRTGWKEKTIDAVLAYLQERRPHDLEFGMTMSGPQRDKIHYVQGGSLFIPHASTGQVRLISLVLRAVQAQWYAEKTKRKPVLLLDDVLLELDPEKKIKFTRMLPEYDQLFCTFLPGEPIENYRRENTKVYYVEDGAFLDE